ncbi:MAG: hypothetical protein PVI23_13255 [Maricaulaceae bacterium]|jgi:hypothetical protein
MSVRWGFMNRPKNLRMLTVLAIATLALALGASWATWEWSRAVGGARSAPDAGSEAAS